MAVHQDYGSRVQALLDKYNAEGQKVRLHTDHRHQRQVTLVLTEEKHHCYRAFFFSPQNSLHVYKKGGSSAVVASSKI